jgi:4-amino-4-deoxy-L-arabinose transferase-like glycosyltransferase
MPLMEPDESRYSSISSFMNHSGDYVTPHLNHVVYLEKPPLCYWATAMLFKIFGENEFSSRLFVALCAWGCILLVFFMGKYFCDEKTGLYSAAIFSTFLYSFILGRINLLDVPLTFFACLAIWAGYRYFSDGCIKKGWLYLLYVAAALAFLTKGLIGIVFPFAIVVTWLLSYRKYTDIFRLFSPVGLIMFLVISAPWVILVQRANPDFFYFFFIQEHFLRYSTTVHHKEQPFWYFVPIVIAGTLPWAAFLLRAVKGAIRSHVSLLKNTDKRYLIIWSVFIFGFFSISSSKLVPYIAPIFLPIAVLLGCPFREYDEQDARMEKCGNKNIIYSVPVVFQSILFIILLVVPPFLKNPQAEGGMMITAPEKWWILMLPLILIQILIIFLPGKIRRLRNHGWFSTIYILTILFLGLLIFPISKFLAPYKSAYPVSQAISKCLPQNQELYQYGVSLYGVEFYNKIRTVIVDDFGELGFGISKLSSYEKKKYFISSEEFYKLCQEKGDVYCITRYKSRLGELRKNISHVDTLWSNRFYYILHLRC